MPGLSGGRLDGRQVLKGWFFGGLQVPEPFGAWHPLDLTSGRRGSLILPGFVMTQHHPIPANGKLKALISRQGFSMCRNFKDYNTVKHFATPLSRRIRAEPNLSR